MLIAVQKDQLIHAVLVDNRQACEMIARAIGQQLDGHSFNIFDEVVLPRDSVFKSFNNLTHKQFFDARHETHISRDPMYLTDDVITYIPYNYILFDLDFNKIIIPDYYDYENGCHLIEYTELYSNYDAYKHAASIITHNKIMQFAFTKNLILVQPTDQHYQQNDTLIRTTYVFREYSMNSQVVNIDFCYCCGTFECQCTQEQIEKYTNAELPF